jgi:hypothetical protein
LKETNGDTVSAILKISSWDDLSIRSKIK